MIYKDKRICFRLIFNQYGQNDLQLKTTTIKITHVSSGKQSHRTLPKYHAYQYVCLCLKRRWLFVVLLPLNVSEAHFKFYTLFARVIYRLWNNIVQWTRPFHYKLEATCFLIISLATLISVYIIQHILTNYNIFLYFKHNYLLKLF